MAAVALPGAAIGIALFGTGDLTTLSGSQIGFGTAVWRVVLVMLYLAAGLAGLAAVGLFISTLTEQPIAASIALLIFTILSWILDAVPQLGWLHPWLIVHEWMSFGDLLRDPIAWDARAARAVHRRCVRRGVLARGLGPVLQQGHHQLTRGPVRSVGDAGGESGAGGAVRVMGDTHRRCSPRYPSVTRVRA